MPSVDVQKILQPSGVQRCTSWAEVKHIIFARSPSYLEDSTLLLLNFRIAKTSYYGSTQVNQSHKSHLTTDNMATQVIVAPPTFQADVTIPTISLPPNYQIQPQDGKLNANPVPPGSIEQPPLGILSNFTGTFAGTGFNLIFRPNSGDTQFGPVTNTNPLPPPPAPQVPDPPNENVLELNLTQESIVFSGSLGTVPNRGLGKQPDINLNGVPYMQSVADVTNTVSGKGDFQPPSPIHFEPGLWMHVPETKISEFCSITITDISFAGSHKHRLLQ